MPLKTGSAFGSLYKKRKHLNNNDPLVVTYNRI